MKPKIEIDDNFIRINSDYYNKITLTEAHSFLKDLIRTIFDYHKKFPGSKLGDYIKET